MTDVEIFWPQAVAAQTRAAAEDALRAAGVESVSRSRPVNRGAEATILVLVTDSMLGPMLSSLFGHLGEGAFDALRTFVSRIFVRPAAAPAESAARVVLFRSAATGAEFVFTSDLPQVAFRQAIDIDPGNEPGRWVWDAGSQSWLRFEESAQTGGTGR